MVALFTCRTCTCSAVGHCAHFIHVHAWREWSPAGDESPLGVAGEMSCSHRKKEISNLTMQVVEEMGDGEDESEEEEESEPEVDIKPVRENNNVLVDLIIHKLSTGKAVLPTECYF